MTRIELTLPPMGYFLCFLTLLCLPQLCAIFFILLRSSPWLVLGLGTLIASLISLTVFFSFRFTTPTFIVGGLPKPRFLRLGDLLLIDAKKGHLFEPKTIRQLLDLDDEFLQRVAEARPELGTIHRVKFLPNRWVNIANKLLWLYPVFIVLLIADAVCESSRWSAVFIGAIMQLMSPSYALVVQTAFGLFVLWFYRCFESKIDWFILNKITSSLVILSILSLVLFLVYLSFKPIAVSSGLFYAFAFLCIFDDRLGFCLLLLAFIILCHYFGQRRMLKTVTIVNEWVVVKAAQSFRPIVLHAKQVKVMAKDEVRDYLYGTTSIDVHSKCIGYDENLALIATEGLGPQSGSVSGKLTVSSFTGVGKGRGWRHPLP